MKNRANCVWLMVGTNHMGAGMDGHSNVRHLPASSSSASLDSAVRRYGWTNNRPGYREIRPQIAIEERAA